MTAAPTRASASVLADRPVLAPARARRLALAFLGAVAGFTPAALAERYSFEASSVDRFVADLPSSKLVLDNEIGAVTIIADAGATEITAQATRQVKARSQSAADAALARLDISFKKDPGTGVIRGVGDVPDSDNAFQASIEWEITVPASLPIEISTDIGAIDVAGCQAGVFLRTDVGEVRAVAVAGGIDIACDVGAVNVRGAGPITIATDVGEIAVNVIANATPAPISLSTGVGEIDLSVPGGDWGPVAVSTGTGRASVSGKGTFDITRRTDNQFRAVIGDASGPGIEMESGVGDAALTLSSAD